MKHQWLVSEVVREDAGGPLYNAVKIVDNRVVEHKGRPTHSRLIAERTAEYLNKRDAKCRGK